MSHFKLQNLQDQTKIRRTQSLKLMLQFILSITSFSLTFFCYSSLILISFRLIYLSFTAHISNLFSCYVERQIIFILCNGIIPFVAGLTRNPTSLEAAVISFAIGVEPRERVGGEGRMPEKILPSASEDLKKQEEDESGRAEEDGNEEGGEDYEDVSLVTDQKIEDFIKKMRKSIKMEALQLQQVP